jgi:hypothetical protein
VGEELIGIPSFETDYSELFAEEKRNGWQLKKPF